MLNTGFFALALGLVATVDAADIVTAKDPAVILEIAKGYGSAELGKDGEGDPRITGRIDGTRYSVLFYGCRDGQNCSDIQFNAGWSGSKATLETINAWNSKKRFGAAYLDDAGDPILQMDVNMTYGVVRDTFDETFGVWAKVMKTFMKELLEN